jgi:hypothetical protein
LIILATLGVDGIVVRELVSRPADQSIMLVSAWLLKLLGGFLL